MTGASWVDIEAIMNFEVSDTTLRARRDEWIAAGVFDQLEAEARAALRPDHRARPDVVAIDGSLHKAPYGGEGTGPSPVDRGKLGWKWSVAVGASGIPIGWSIDGANRNDVVMLEPTLDAVAATGLLADIGTLHLDRGYDYPAIRDRLTRPRARPTSTSNAAAPSHRPARRTGSRSGCAGSSRQPTHGGRTTANCAATPTARPATATPRCGSPPPSSSSADSSTTATDGAPTDHLPAQVLRARCQPRWSVTCRETQHVTLHRQQTLQRITGGGG